MKNDLNVFEIMGEKDPGKGQEQDAPDRIFREEIRKAMSRQESASGPEHEKKHKIQKKRSKWDWKNLAIEAGAAFFAVLLIFNFVINVSRVSGDSMKPEICDGDRIVVSRLDRNYEKGDIVVFRTQDGKKLIKRIIAREGDTVDISAAGGLYINGEAVSEEYVYTVTTISDPGIQYPVTVGEDSYFLLGDNRSQSEDSRQAEIGNVKKKDIVGQVILVIKGV